MIMNESEQTHILQTQLERYAAQDLYPFHMPGHKRRMSPAPGLPFAWDVTEVPGTDDLHDASGILLDAMQRSASLWGADRTWYLVNGSTCGLLAAIRALAKPGSEILCARNCHKAVFHAIELAGCRVRWIMPAVDEDWGICTGITAEQVRKMLRRNPDVKALIQPVLQYKDPVEVSKVSEAPNSESPATSEAASAVSAAPTSNTASTVSSSSNIGLIIGIVIGVILLLIVIVVLILVLRKKK